MKRILLTSIVALAAASAVQAEGVYLGSGFARVNGEEPGYKYGSTNILGLVGYDINPYMAIEAELSFALSKDTIIIGSTAVDIGMEHFAAFTKFTLPISGSIKPYARLGMSKGEASATVGSTTVSVSDSAFSYGVGAEFTLDENTGIRLDYSTADYGITKGTVLALTTVYRF